MMPINREDVEREKSIRRLREQFHGKAILLEEGRNLMRKYNNDYDLVTRAIVAARDRIPGDAQEEDLRRPQNDAIVQVIANRIRGQRRRNQDAPEGASAEPDEEEASQRSSNEESADGEEDGSVSAGLVSDEDEEGASRDGLDAEDAFEEDPEVRAIADRLNRLPFTVKNVNMHNLALRGEMPTVDCLFSCEPCQWSWWRRVPERKLVSRCRKCRVCYDPVPGIHQWGYALFTCVNCNNSFRAYGKMGVGMLCYTCRTMVLPSEILPPRRNEVRQQPVVRVFQEHSCYAVDCCNRREPYVADLHCVHPSTRRARGLPVQLYFSQRHERTDSTVATCVSQGDLMENEDDIIQRDLDLERIPEEVEGDND